MHKSIWLGVGLALLAAAPALACTDIASKTVKFSACIDDEWAASKNTEAQEFGYVTADQNFALTIITEKASFPAKTLHDAIITNAINGTGGKASDITIVGEGTQIIGGKEFSVLEYTLANNGNPILIEDFYYSTEAYGTIQLMAFGLQSSATRVAFKAGVLAGTVKMGS